MKIRSASNSRYVHHIHFDIPPINLILRSTTLKTDPNTINSFLSHQCLTQGSDPLFKPKDLRVQDYPSAVRGFRHPTSRAIQTPLAYPMRDPHGNRLALDVESLHATDV